MIINVIFIEDMQNHSLRNSGKKINENDLLVFQILKDHFLLQKDTINTYSLTNVNFFSKR